MPGEKQRNSKTRGRRGAVAALGVAGALSLSGACSASASTNPAGNTRNSQVLLAEEEVSDVSLSTFYVFDRENAYRPGVQLAAGHGCGGGGRGCAARGCDVAVGAEGVEAVVAGVAVVVAVVVAAAVAVFGLALSASVKRVPRPAGWILT